MNRHASPAGVGSPTKHLPAVLTACLGILISVAVFIMVRDSEQARVRTVFERDAKDVFSVLRGLVDEDLLALELLASFYAGSQAVERQEFQVFVRPFLLQHGCIQALEWIPWVRDADRAAFEEAARQEGFPGFQITERQSQGRMVSAARRDEYFPVYFVEPYKGNEIALGFDLASDPTRLEALQRSCDTGKMVATARITLVQETARQFGFLVFQPVFRKGAPTGSARDRRANLEGFALGVFRIGDLLEHALSRLEARDLDFALYDMSAPVGERLLAFHSIALGQPPAEAPEEADVRLPSGLHWTATMDVAERQWLMVCIPGPEFLAAQRDWQSWAVLAAGLVLTTFLMAYLLIRIRQAARAEWFAAALASTNENLQTEIAERQQAEEALRESETKFRTVFDAAADGMFVLDLESQKFVISNAACSTMLGYTPEEILNLSISDLHLPEDLPLVSEQIGMFMKGEAGIRRDIRFKRKDGSTFFADLNPILILLGGRRGILVTIRDITDRKRAEEALQQANTRLDELATTDDLTGLANRRGFMEAIGLEAERARRYGSDLALVMIDVDGFKAINDMYGHMIGDRILVEVAKAFKDSARATDLVARYGGDEIVILMPNTDVHAAVSAVERIRRRIAGRVVSDGQRSLEVTISAGVRALDSKDRTAGPDLLVRQADEALYAAKHAGGNVTKTWNEIPRDRTGENTGEAARVENLRREVAGLSLQAKEMVVQSLGGLVHALEARDAYTKAHSANVTRYAVAIAETLELDPEEMGVIRRAALIHDLGKIAVPDSILRKRGVLDDHERRIMQGHVLAGVKIIDEMHFLERETPVVRHHHERWNGGGYPDGIAGEAIPLGARILAVADAFDAITSARVYRNARSVSDALQILVEESGQQFAPGVVDAMVKWVRATGRELGKESDLAVADLLSPIPAEAVPVAP